MGLTVAMTTATTALVPVADMKETETFVIRAEHGQCDYLFKLISVISMRAHIASWDMPVNMQRTISPIQMVFFFVNAISLVSLSDARTLNTCAATLWEHAQTHSRTLAHTRERNLTH